MAVYVDELKPALWKYRKSCHLYADTLKELHEFAIKIGMKRTWFQDRLGFPHYDLTAGRRKAAVLWGAIEHDKFQMVAFVKKRREKKDGEENSQVADVQRQKWEGQMACRGR